jgi:hypothetical protein
VLAANPRRNDGGILTRLPKGVYLPVLGVTFGDGTTPESTKVLQVTKMYDGVGDSPDYIFNIASDLNAAMASTICIPVTTRPSTRMTRPRSSPPVPTAPSPTS